MSKWLAGRHALYSWRRRWLRALAVGLVCCTALLVTLPARGQMAPSVELHSLINAARLSQGLAPLGQSKLLSQAAQRHAADVAKMGTVSHQGSDGSDYRQRIREVRYDAWEDGLMVNEVYWMGLGNAKDALTWMLNNAEMWEILTSPRYREVGIGYAEDGQVHFFVINVGSRPGVLPVFINDGAEATDSPIVAVRLTNEEAVPLGEGTWMGRAIEVRLSNSPDFADIPWQPWEALLPWLLEGTTPGEYAVYVQYRDGAGRTATVGDTIQLMAPGEAPLATPFQGVIGPSTQAGADPLPSPVATPETLPAGEDAPLQTATPGEPATPVARDPGVVLTPYPTWTPLPSSMPLEADREGPDWPVMLALGLQGLVVILGIAVFLRRR